MLLTKRKSTERRLVTTLKAERRASRAATPPTATLDHDKQLAVVDAIEWAVERWASRDLVERSATDPRAAHANRLIAALIYLDPRFERLELPFVTQVIETVASAPSDTVTGPRLDAKAAAALLAVEVGAFRR